MSRIKAITQTTTYRIPETKKKWFKEELSAIKTEPTFIEEKC